MNTQRGFGGGQPPPPQQQQQGQAQHVGFGGGGGNAGDGAGNNAFGLGPPGMLGGRGGGGGPPPTMQGANTGSGGAFDLAADFPALGGHGPPGGGQHGSPPRAVQHQTQSEFQMANEDFPALGGGAGGVSVVAAAAAAASTANGRVPPGGQSAGGQSSQATQNGASMTGQGPIESKPNTGAAPHDRFGLLGLLSVIRMTSQDLNTLALGTDLTTLGLNLNSSEPLYSSFAIPWADRQTPAQPDFQVPPCYVHLQKPVPPLTSMHLSSFSVQTLFYVFYSMAKDVLQAAAAKELYNRDWRYHTELKLWFTRMPANGKAQQENVFWYWDVNQWEKRMTPPQEMKNLRDAWERRPPDMKLPD